MTVPYVSQSVGMTAGDLQQVGVPAATALPNNSVGVAGGTVNALTLSPTTPLLDYVSNIGKEFLFTASGTNTTAITVAISGLAALTATMGSVALPVGGLLSGNMYRLVVESATSVRIAAYDAVSVNGDTMTGTLVLGAGLTSVGNATIGTGVAGAGWLIGARSDNATSCLYSTNVTPSIYNYALQVLGTTTYLNAITNANIAINNAIVAQTTASSFAVTGSISATTTISTGGYTVATLPAGVVGQRVYVTDALAPVSGAAVVGGGAVVIPVFRNATVWVVA